MIQVGEKKFSIGAYITILAIILVLIVMIFSMYKYSIEGESKPPFIIPKIVVTSGAKTTNMVEEENGYTATVLQNNDIKIAIEKNPEYKKEAKIKTILLNNIQISTTNKGNEIALYRPSQGSNLYDYQDSYKIDESLEYYGALETNIKGEKLQISNQGGILEFSVAQYDLGKLEYKANEQINVDGTLLNSINVKQEDITFKLTFDMIIELENGIKLKTTITMDLPKGNISENGIEIYEHTDIKTVFKRI